ncbi:MAG: ABC transporter ATP-binding protein [Pseudomonadota bacterium]
MTRLVVDGVSKRFGGLMAVNNVSLAAEPGQIFSIIGPNGAGKSTLFKLISGFETPTTGHIWIDKSEITGWSPHRIAAAGLIRTFQENTIFSSMTAREAVLMAQHHKSRASALAMILTSKRAREDERRFRENADKILERFGLNEVADQPCSVLPQGHLRILGIAIALAADPKVLLLDEPFAGLNHAETDQGMALIRELADSGMTIILVEHDMRAVMAVSQLLLVLNFGTVIAQGTPTTILQDPAVIEAYLGTEDEDL